MNEPEFAMNEKEKKTSSHHDRPASGSTQASDARLRALWEQYRDGELTAAQRREFDERLADSRDDLALWQRESAWLGALRESEHQFDDGAAFARRAVDHWRAQQRGPVIGRIGALNRRHLAVAAAWAAGLALVVWIGQSQWRHGSSADPSLPVGVLVQHAEQEYAQQAARFGRMVDRSSSIMDIQNVMGLLIRPMPQSTPFFDFSTPDSQQRPQPQ